jgi:hypothetical protein
MADDKQGFSWDDEEKKAGATTATAAPPDTGAGFQWEKEEPPTQQEQFAQAKARVAKPTEFEKKHEVMSLSDYGNEIGKPSAVQKVGVEGGLGLASGFSGMPESKSPLTDVYKQLKTESDYNMEHPVKSAVEKFGMGPGTQLLGLGKGLYNAGAEVVGGLTGTGENPEGKTGPERIAHGVGSGLGQVAQVAVGAKAPEAVGERSTTLRKIGGEPFGIGVTGEELLKKGVSPRAQATGYDAAMARPGVQRALVEHNAENPIRSAADLNEAIPLMKEKIWKEQVEPALERQAQRPVDMHPAADAVRKTISPEMQKFEPAHAEELNKLADNLEGSLTIEAANRLLTYANGKLESYFVKYPSARRANLMNNPETAGWESARRAIREQFLNTLEQAGEKQVREARQDYGGLETLGKEVERRVNVADRQKPMSLSRILGYVGALPTGGLSVAAGELANHLNKPDVLISRGISRLKPPAATPFTPPAPFTPEAARPEPVQPKITDLGQQARNPQEGPKPLSAVRSVAGAQAGTLEPIERGARTFAKEAPTEFKGVLKDTGWEYGGKNSMGIHEFKDPKTNISISVKDSDFNPATVRQRIAAKLSEFGR